MDCTYEEFRRLLTIEDAQEKGLPTPYKEARQKAKITLFATLYGAGAPKIAEGLGITEKEAQAYIDAIYAQFPKTKQWKEESEQYARINGSVPIHGGTIRHLNSLIYSDDKYTASKALRQAGNARIQSAGGNQIKRVMSRIWDSDIIERFDYRWYFSVHDETFRLAYQSCTVS
jgi:DNA polymerase-1